MEQTEKKIDFFTDDIQQNLDQIAKSDDNNKFAFVSFEDIQTLANFNENEQKKQDEMFLVIKCPKGTLFEIPEINDVNEKYPH